MLTLRLYSYVVRYDVGFAPNPFHGWCTLATCKQDIRARAGVGDWIVGTGSRASGLGDHLVYAMQVQEVMTFDQYWHDPRFQRKRPRFTGSVKAAYGDNIYHRDSTGRWQQEDSRHSLPDGTPNAGHVERDTKSDRVLVSRRFVYYGGRAIRIPERFRNGYDVDLVHGKPSYRVNFPVRMRDDVIDWVCGDLNMGLQGEPYAWDHPQP